MKPAVAKHVMTTRGSTQGCRSLNVLSYLATNR